MERKLNANTIKAMKEFFVAQYELYQSSVVHGHRVAGKLERDMIDRQAEDLKRTDWIWHFDVNKAVAPLIWMMANLVFPSGEKKGKPLKLESWQVWITMVLFGWVNKDGNRRYIDAYLEIARKNGKSVYAAAVLCYLAFSKAENNANPCYIAATSREQAGECFSRAKDSLSNCDGLRVRDSYASKELLMNGNRICVISAEPKDGKLAHGAIIDEYHQHRSNDLINSITSGNVADPNVMIFRITTAGTNLMGVCKQEHDKGIKVLEGSILMERYFFAIYTIDEGDSADDPNVWEKANPNYGVSVDKAMLYGRYDYSKSSKADMIVFKTKNLNVWVNSLDRWADMDVWIEKCSEPFEAEELKKKTCYGGLDLSHNSDFTAFVLDFPDGEIHKQLYYYFIPEDRVMELERQLVVPISQWVSDGLIIATPGPVVDYSYVAKVISDARQTYDLRLIGADPWHLDYLDQHMPEWFRDLTTEFSQQIKTMGPAIQHYERAYKLGQIQSGGNPVQKWMMSCAESRPDVNANVRIVKPNVSKSEARIDGVIASIISFEVASRQLDAGLSGDVKDILSFY